MLRQFEKGFAELVEIVRRDVGRHSHRDAGRAVHEQLRQPRGDDDGLGLRAVVVGPIIDGALGQLLDQLGGERSEAALGVAHRRGCIAVKRAKIAVPVDQGVAEGEILRHPHQRVVDGDVAVRVVLPHDGAHDLGALLILRLVRQAVVVEHPVDDAPLHWLEPVAHVGQRARSDDAERVVEIAAARLFVEEGRHLPARRRRAVA